MRLTTSYKVEFLAVNVSNVPGRFPRMVRNIFFDHGLAISNTMSNDDMKTWRAILWGSLRIL